MKSVCKYAIIFPVSIQIFGNAVLFSDFRFREGILINDEKGKEPHSQAFLGGNVMRKVVSVLLSAAMALSLCAGCSSSSSDTADTKAAEEKGADAADTEAGEAAEGVMPAVAKEDLKVGVIHIGNPADGSGYSYTHDQGIVAMQKAVGLEDDQIIRKNNVADDDQTAIETAMRECVEEGCQIIFATSWGYMDACEALAEEYPDVIFSHATGYKSNGVNFNNYFGRIYQSRYLTGIAAGLKTESNKIGYVGAWGKDNAAASGLADRPIRWLVDDCAKFVAREKRRGNTYDGIIMDPPSYGRGPGGEIWKLEDCIYDLISQCEEVLSDTPLFFAVNSYTTGLSPAVMEYMLKTTLVPRFGGKTSCDEIGLPVSATGGVVPCGATAIWEE